MFKEADIETTLELPYTLIDIGEDEERFVFAFRRFDENQTDYSIQAGGLTGKFEVMYRCKGMESKNSAGKDMECVWSHREHHLLHSLRDW